MNTKIYFLWNILQQKPAKHTYMGPGKWILITLTKEEQHRTHLVLLTSVWRLLVRKRRNTAIVHRNGIFIQDCNGNILGRLAMHSRNSVWFLMLHPLSYHKCFIIVACRNIRTLVLLPNYLVCNNNAPIIAAANPTRWYVLNGRNTCDWPTWSLIHIFVLR